MGVNDQQNIERSDKLGVRIIICKLLFILGLFENGIYNPGCNHDIKDKGSGIIHN
jgi:hypothetical protein